MKLQNAIKMIGGGMVFSSSLLGYLYNPAWLFITMFVGANFFQFSMTGFCPLGIILKKAGMKD